MASVSIKSLVSKLDPMCHRALEAAAGLCVSRTNYNLEIEHWLAKLIETANTDLAAILRFFEIDPARLQRDLTRRLDSLKTGNAAAPALSPNTVKWAQEAWLIASVEYGAGRVRSGHMLCALLGDEDLKLRAEMMSAEFGRINVEALRKALPDVTANTEEAATEVAAAASAPSAGGAPGTPGAKLAGPSKTPFLDQFTNDLTAKAKAGKIDPILGRDNEIRQVIDILTRRRQNNPILTGEAGVGKTAVVEGFAQRIARGDVPPQLRNVSIRELDMGLLQAGAGVKGEFENRLKSVIDEVKASPTPIIMFIDEAHTLIGAGGAAGQNDAANLLKPALARGELRTIAATTWAEYKKYFEKDAALTRRFQVVKVEEPVEKVAIEMMRGLVATLEKHHDVRILDEGVFDSVRLSNRYIAGRQLPDKSVSLLDTACARVGVSQAATPGPVEDCRRRLDQLETTLRVLKREAETGTDHNERIAEVLDEQGKRKTQLEQLETRWKQEADLIKVIREMYDKLAGIEPNRKPAPLVPGPTAAVPVAPATPGQVGAPAAPASPAAAAAAQPVAPAKPLTEAERVELRQQLNAKRAELKALQGESPLMQVFVDAQAIAEVVSDWTGIPVGRMVSDEIRTILNLKQTLEDRIVGQSHALEAVAQSIRTSRARLTDPSKPIGVFLMVGPSGVGKTETALTLAELLYGGEHSLTTINMSEFKEEHKVSLLMGSPPGYVGYGEGGVLTEAVRRKPYSVLLLDEMEKAHPGVQDIFYQVFDKGQMKDGEGRDIDFKNTVIIMTSNAASDTIMKLCADPETCPDAAGLAAALHPELLKTFKPAFLGRLSLVPYFPLTDEVLKNITRLKLGKVARRIRENYKAVFTYGDEVVQSIVSRCTEVQTGARNIDHIVERTLLPELSAQFLQRMADSLPIAKVVVGLNEGGTFKYDIA